MPFAFLAALELWHRIGELVDDNCGFETHGQIRVAEDEAAAATLHRREARWQALGYTHERWIDADALFARVPALARHCVGALIAERDGAARKFNGRDTRFAASTKPPRTM